ncbi:hypothetical protein PanWU01x14_055010 [Parasponia andersonii]|uniref:Uncharacterized protein n=1 Tax=Parasponia andersonii TaxID=3476 RepID=A0A2P5DKX2_PARAD|nr:hypothetical protein PanWU01x14_055010 [Parasponia andersonii]
MENNLICQPSSSITVKPIPLCEFLVNLAPPPLWRLEKNELKLLIRVLPTSIMALPSMTLIALISSKVKKILDELLAQEELYWYQRSCTAWLQVGDLNTRFFFIPEPQLGKRTMPLPKSKIQTAKWLKVSITYLMS